jgi:tetratricopeptide (TPR) repeat protein
MPLKPSDDFGARLFAGATELSVHNHLFPAANTGVAWLRRRPDVVAAHQRFLQDAMRVDLFGVREDGEIDGRLVAPLRPAAPTLEPGKKYLLETVIRTLKLGHLFTQGTADSNEVWLDVIVKAGDRVIGRSGSLDATRGNEVDPWAHFVNVFMLDKNGNRIDRRNPQDIFTPLYNHQIPPGAGQTVHYELTLPQEVDAPVTVEVKLQYRKFDQRYMDFVARAVARLGQPIRGHTGDDAYANELPVTTLAVDRVTFAVAGVDAEVHNPQRDVPDWQRWNDYGIGLLLKGKAELRQAGEAFAEVERLQRWDGPMNLARAYLAEGRLDEAVAALERAQAYRGAEGFPRWTWAWLSGEVNRQQGRLEEAVVNLRSVLEDRTEDMLNRGFDFSYDYEVINLLGQTLFDLGRLRTRQRRQDEARGFWQEAVDAFQRTLAIDSENVTAHHNLQLLYAELGDAERAAEHEKLHLRYKSDDNAQGRAERLARERYPAANHAAEAVVKYSLQRPGAPGLLSTEPTQAAGEPDQDAAIRSTSAHDEPFPQADGIGGN